MKLEGSCHCGHVHFSLESAHPYPYNHCYCSICRKTAGGGGYAINLGGEFASLQITGEEHIRCYQAMIENPETGESEQSPARRHFAENVAALYGYGTRAGQSWCIRLLPPLTASYQPPQNIHI